MKIRQKALILLLANLLPIVIIGGLSYWQFQKVEALITGGLPASISNLTRATRLNSYAHTIRYYDELLTQSARNYAFTGDLKWAIRYNDAAPKLDKVIGEALLLASDEDKIIFSRINISNQTLVEMEMQVQELVKAGQSDQAIKVLDSEKYIQNKKLYADGLMEFAERTSFSYDEAVTQTENDTQTLIKNISDRVLVNITAIILTVLLSILITILVSWWFSYLLTSPLILLKDMAEKTAAGKEETIDITGNDEVGELARAFQKMVDHLKQAQKNVESHVIERTAQLEKLNQAMVGRELKMIELKKQLTALHKK